MNARENSHYESRISIATKELSSRQYRDKSKWMLDTKHESMPYFLFLKRDMKVQQE